MTRTCAVLTMEQLEVASKAASSRLGLKIQYHREATSDEIAVSARYSKQVTTFLSEATFLYASTADVIDIMLDAASRAKLELCSAVQADLGIERDRDETADIVNAAYEYRLACAEIQPAWEHMLKMPAGTGIREAAVTKYNEKRERAAKLREKLVRLAQGSFPEEVK